MKKSILFFGGTGGLGTQVIKHLDNYEVKSLGSKDVDFLDETSILSFFNSIEKVDVLIIFTNYNYNGFLHKYNESNFDELSKQIEVNILSVTKIISKCLTKMRENNFGRIILSSSVTVDKNVMGTSIYAASKSYYENIVKTICLENASKNITANCIQLGYMDGGLTYTLSEEFIKKTIDSIPSKRLGKPEEISKTIDFLINNEYINGTPIKLTGGL
jgi:NAD(P)-dependent dehydrogenase (short-subunit alcohol dehydrogenase family)